MLLWFVCRGSFGLHLNQNKSESKSLNLPRCSHNSVFIPCPPVLCMRPPAEHPGEVGGDKESHQNPPPAL